VRDLHAEANLISQENFDLKLELYNLKDDMRIMKKDH
jgi:hypothetical protein